MYLIPMTNILEINLTALVFVSSFPTQNKAKTDAGFHNSVVLARETCVEGSYYQPLLP